VAHCTLSLAARRTRQRSGVRWPVFVMPLLLRLAFVVVVVVVVAAVVALPQNSLQQHR